MGRSKIKKIFILFNIVLIVTFGFISFSFAQTSVSRGMRELSVEEYNKRFINRDANQTQAAQINGGGYFSSFERPLDVIIGNEDVTYKIVPGDSLKISFQDRSVVSSAVYQVSGMGEVFFPLVGPIEVGGLNRAQATEQINERLRKYIRNPNVNIEINTSGKIMVVGSVRSPGVYNLTPRLTLMEAIMNARFDQKAAKLKNVIVMRGPPDKPLVKSLDLKKMIKSGDRSDNIFLKPGDLIYVPNSRIKNIENFIANIYDKVLIWYGLGGQDIIKEGEEFIGPFN